MRSCDYCGRPHRARGMCSVHYELWRRKNPLEVDNRSGRWADVTCAYPDCGSPVRTQGMCMKHYQQFYYAAKKEKP